jgi:triacylglycerol lipase
MISELKPKGVNVLSLTTIATPHHGSAFADYLFQRIGPMNIPRLYKALEFFGFETGAFEQLTNKYMAESFNPRTPDSPDVRYFSYGAQLNPHLTSVFRKSHGVVKAAEGENDGLVSVQSSQWGEYKGTLDNVSHLDLINWTNRLRVRYLMNLSETRTDIVTVRNHLQDRQSVSLMASLLTPAVFQRWYLWSLTGTPRNFNAIAFYLHITGMSISSGI